MFFKDKGLTRPKTEPVHTRLESLQKRVLQSRNRILKIVLLLTFPSFSLEKTDKYSVQIFEILTPILLNTIYAIAALYIAKHAFVSYFFAIHKNEITNLSSQISNLKLKLKRRLTHKFNNVATFGNDEITAVIMPFVNDIKDLEFQKSEDYQVLLAKMIEINNEIKVEEKLFGKKSPLKQIEPSPSVAPELDLVKKTYTDLFEFDKGIVAIIIEIYRLHADYLKALREYNKYADLEKNQKLVEKIPDPILIENFYLLEDIYTKYKKELKDKSDSDIDAQDEDSQNKKAS